MRRLRPLIYGFKDVFVWDGRDAAVGDAAFFSGAGYGVIASSDLAGRSCYANIL
jgi:hypothetical protein